MEGVLYLVPNTLGNPDMHLTIPPGISEKVASINVFIVENLRNARRYLKKLNREIVIDQLTFHELNEHTLPEQIPSFLEAGLAGSDVAIISEAGVPCVADPGALLVRIAHEKGMKVVPLTGPSSILLALMGSGFNGQSFKFLGYLPVKKPDRIRRIREIEQEVKRTGVTQLFIETPYRNETLLHDILDNCHSSSLLCIAADLTLDSEFIATMNIGRWKMERPGLHKRPAVFLMGN